MAWPTVFPPESDVDSDGSVVSGRFANENRPVKPGDLERNKWSDGESNPDLLNAIQPSSR